jgi:two-component system sensor histidine kinase MprB
MITWLRRFSIRSRLSVLIAGAVFISVALASLATYLVADHQLSKQVDSSLEATADTLTTAGPNGVINTFNAARFLDRLQPGFVLQVIPAQGPPLFSSSVALPESAADRAVALNQGTTALRNATVHGVSYRILTIGQSSDGRQLQTADGTPVALEIGRPLTDLDHTLGDLRLILFVVTLASVAFAVGLGYLVSRATILPVQRLTSAAEHVAETQELTETIDETGNDELTRLARAFNAMLRALAASRQQQAQLVSDAGHELRTPLTSLRTNIEVLMRVQDLPVEDRAELLADVRAQLEELTTLIGDIVELGRYDEQPPEPTEVRFNELVERAVARARRRAPSIAFQQQLDLGSVRAQPALLERAVLNVLDNAAKWSPPGGTVEIWLQRTDRWMLDVRDHGPGIAAEDIPRVFDRFWRASTARAMPGSGLGLAIVRQIVNDHGGSVNIWCPDDGGTVVHVELPIVAEQEPDGHWWDELGVAPIEKVPVATGNGANLAAGPVEVEERGSPSRR